MKIKPIYIRFAIYGSLIAVILAVLIPSTGRTCGGMGKYFVTRNDLVVAYFDAVREGRVPRPISYVELHPSIKYSVSNYRPCIIAMSRDCIMVQIDKKTRVFYDVSWGSLVDGSRHFDFKESSREKDSNPSFFELVEK